MFNFLIPLVVTIGTALVAMLIFLGIRHFVERRRGFWQKRLYTTEERETPSLVDAEVMPVQYPGWRAWLDHRFEQLVKQTGSQWHSEQVLGLIALCCVSAA